MSQILRILETNYNIMARDLSGMPSKKKKTKIKAKRPRKRITKKDRKKMASTLRKRGRAEIRREKAEGTFTPIVTVVRTKKPPVRRYTYVEYDFLKYIRIVFKWAQSNYPELKKADLEMLLYLYPNGAFTQTKFHIYHKTMGLYAVSKFKKLMSEGWIKLWRPRKNNEAALYVLSMKAKSLCTKMHKLCCGAQPMAKDRINNKIIRDALDKNKPKVNNYYLDMMKKMNKDRPE